MSLLETVPESNLRQAAKLENRGSLDFGHACVIQRYFESTTTITIDQGVVQKMKTMPSLLVSFTLTAVALISVLNGAPIELIDIEGRKVVAEIVSQQGDRILIRKDDGKDYLFPVTRLTKETRDSIAEKIKEINRMAEFKWKYHVTTDELTSKPTYLAVVKSINQVSFDFPYKGAQRAELMQRTHPQHGKDLILRVEKGQMLVRSYEDTTVEVVFDQGTPISYRVAGPADHSTTSLFIRDSQGFIESMLKAKKVKISVPFYQQGNVVFEFNVSDFESDRYLNKK
jgi:hypothetical protein